jgi:drug/metabolite transporter (DMT)-like permease
MFAFIPITIIAAGFQVARNALQRSLLGGAGPWGATLVRFLFGLPFSLIFVAIAWAIWPEARAHFSGRFWLWAIVGSITQIGATAALLSSMGRSGFALGAAFQQSSLPFAAAFSLFVLHEGETGLGWAGIALATASLLALSWPRRVDGIGDMGGALYGLASGAFYGVALNAYREANLAIDPHHAVFAAVVTTSTTQAMQAAAMTAYLGLRDRTALKAVLGAWRQSLGAGFFGAAASALWLTALAMSPAGPVRAVGVIEMPLSALVGRRLFAERLSWKQLALGGATAVGVVLAAFG